MTLKTYHIVEFDANEIPTVLRAGLTRNEAREKLTRLREYNRVNRTLFRYVMYRDKEEKPADARTGDYLWTGSIRAEN